MTKIRESRYCKDIEDIPNELEHNTSPKIASVQQKKTGFRFSVGSTNDVNPDAFYNAYFDIASEIVKIDDNAIIGNADITLAID